MKNIIVAALVILSCSPIINAQNIITSTLQWNSQSTLEANEGQQTEEVTSFITYGKTRMEWKDNNGSIRKNLQIIEVIGEWPDINQPGRVQYEVTDGSVSGTISIKKDESETKVFIVMAEEPARSYVLTISGFQVL